MDCSSALYFTEYTSSPHYVAHAILLSIFTIRMLTYSGKGGGVEDELASHI